MTIGVGDFGEILKRLEKAKGRTDAGYVFIRFAVTYTDLEGESA